MDKGKGKAIANDSATGNNSQEERLECPRVREINLGAYGEGAGIRGTRLNGSRTTGEMLLGAPFPNNNNFGLEPGDGRWVLRGDTFIREIILPPLAHRSIYDTGMNPNFFPWVRVYAPPTIGSPTTISNFGEGTSAQGAAMLNGTTARGINLFAHAPIFDMFGRLMYIPSDPQVEMINSYPITRAITLSEPHSYLNISRDGTSAQEAVLQDTQASCASFVSSLNPNAPKWCQAAVEARTLFVTFSLGHPLTSNQVFWFLAMSFGINSLVEVDINQPREGPARFGRLVFTTVTIPMMILRGREEARLMIYGKSMICKKWQPKKDRQRPD